MSYPKVTNVGHAEWDLLCSSFRCRRRCWHHLEPSPCHSQHQHTVRQRTPHELPYDTELHPALAEAPNAAQRVKERHESLDDRTRVAVGSLLVQYSTGLYSATAMTIPPTAAPSGSALWHYSTSNIHGTTTRGWLPAESNGEDRRGGRSGHSDCLALL